MTPDNVPEIWLADFEFRQPDGHHPEVICMVAREHRSGRIIRLLQDEVKDTNTAPFDTGSCSLFVAYYAPAELSCFLALNWPLPVNVLDLYVEFRNMTNGLVLPHGRGVLGALFAFGLDGILAVEKEDMRQLVMRDGPYSSSEHQAILDYCESDVKALADLLPRMLPKINLPRALLRGEYLKAVATMEHCGIPLDVPLATRISENRIDIRQLLITEVDRNYNVFENGCFSTFRFVEYLKRHHIPWPVTASGLPSLNKDKFKAMAQLHPELEPLRQLMKTLPVLNANKLAIGPDGRNRCMLSSFASKTGRNQPSNSKFVFGLPAWMRSLIQAEPGHGIAYIDWSQQEFGIAAALSGDTDMQQAYLTGDPYMGFARLAGAVPKDAMVESHPQEREIFKTVTLAVQYGMGYRLPGPEAGS